MYSSISIIVVLYHPDIEHLKQCVESLQEDSYTIILVDNTPGGCDCSCLKVENIHMIQNGENLGIATAQNIGIRKSKALSCEYAFFFDQDSDINSDFVKNLFSEYQRLSEVYPNLAALGPRVINKSTGKFYKEEDEEILHDAKIVSTLISSGSIIPMRVLDDVGYMEERLFIDYVDFEWAWRAQREGYICCITNHVLLYHQVGKRASSLFGYPVIISSPVRYYYQYRNSLALLKRKYVPLRWKILNTIRKICEFAIVPFYIESASLFFRNAYKGIKDGYQY